MLQHLPAHWFWLCITAGLAADAGGPAVRSHQTWPHAWAALAPAVSSVNAALGDVNGDGLFELYDFSQWPGCVTGPAQSSYPSNCQPFDADSDLHVDLRDFRRLQEAFGQVKTLSNDWCAAPFTIGDGLTTFDTVGATTDGPNEPVSCNFFGYTQIDSDIWFCYQATCTGEAVISLCGSNYDTRLAVYHGCTCPPTSPLRCSDDNCGVGFESRVTLSVQLGQSYLIRVGGFRGAQGAGTLSIRCGVEVCGPTAGECFFAHPSPGCRDVACCETTCAADPFCCDVEWDGFCAEEANGLCTGGFASCETGTGSCGTPHASAGCNDSDCCNTVCQTDPFCCIDMWDENCVSEALGLCLLACGDPFAGSCFLAHSAPGCSDHACCKAVCAEDVFCCQVDWDADCAGRALTLCR